MNITKNIATYLSISLACLMLVSRAAYAGVAGYAQFVNGSVQIVSTEGQTRTLQKGDAVNEGDTVISAKAASAQIKMQDGGFIAMRPDTKLKIDQFTFDGQQDGTERSFFSLFKGGFRAVTGLIGKMNKTNYHITTGSATIGVRGTDHETFVVTPDSSLANTLPIGTYNKVNVGETTITTDKGTIFVLPNQMGFAGAADQMPELRPLNTDIFTIADRPTKEAKGDKKEGKEVSEHAVVDNTAKERAANAPTHG
ncbi:MAG TPA: FecR domain-containing protein, partial [Gallionella sp.]